MSELNAVARQRRGSIAFFDGFICIPNAKTTHGVSKWLRRYVVFFFRCCY